MKKWTFLSVYDYLAPMSEKHLKAGMPILRDDAMKNRAEILAAAQLIFCAKGVNAPLGLVAQEAGVGRATLYRNFPDRRALLAAMLEWSVDEMDVRANKVVAMADGLFRLLDWQAQTIAQRAPLIDYWRIMDRRAPEILAARRRMRNIYRPLLRKAIEEGLCRPDIRVEDILLVSVMLGAALRAGPDAGAAQTARQMLGLIVKGLR